MSSYFDVDKIKGDIAFKNIEFSYVPVKKVLKDFTVDKSKPHTRLFIWE